ncbi:MAG TPA: CapA family protein [Bacteroidota bacterium]|nr:CapA family protein [Bacteroidota bacterium]
MIPAEATGERWLRAAGLAAFSLYCIWTILLEGGRRQAAEPAFPAPVAQSFSVIRMLALGDINLGRRVGQVLLKGDTLYPFARVADTLLKYDIVFANLESNISDQKGRTEHPANNMIFTAPPAAALSLKRAGVCVVSTANNHALDFGVSARDQTIRYLDSAGIAHSGTALREEGLYRPALLNANGIRVAFFAVTDLMNGAGRRWKDLVAPADTEGLLPAIRSVRDSADIVVVSYHGGVEYAPESSERTRAFSRQVLDGGADIVLGHHPHIPYGVDTRGGKVAVHSLGNFVFMQPDRYWTRFSFAVSFDIVRDAAGTRIRSLRALPLRAGFQPEFLAPGKDAEFIRDRVRLLSSQDAQEHMTW